MKLFIKIFIIFNTSFFWLCTFHKFLSPLPIELFPSPAIPSAISITGHGQKFLNLAKLYINEANYSDKNNSFVFKITIFHNICAHANISQKT